MTQRCQICEQGLYDDHIISEKYSVRNIRFNNFETRIYPLSKNLHILNKPERNVLTVRRKHHMQGILEYHYLGMEN